MRSPTFASLLILLGILASVGGVARAAPPATLEAAWAAEEAELVAEREALAAEVQAARQRQQSRASALRREVAQLEKTVLEARTAAAAAEVLAQQSSRDAQTGQQHAARLAQTARAARAALSALIIQVPDPTGAAPGPADAPDVGLDAARLAIEFRLAAEAIGRFGRLRTVPSNFFDADGNQLVGRVALFGRVAALGIDAGGKVGGTLGPGPERTWVLLGADDASARDAALALATEQPLATAPLLLFDPTLPPEPAPVVKTWRDTLDAAGIIGVVILGLGALCLLIALERLLTLSLLGAGRNVTTLVSARIHAGDLAGARKAAEGTGAVRRVAATLLSEPDESHSHLDEVAARAVFRELPRLERLLPLIKTIAAAAPLLGLLGTVTGMIATFDIITEVGTGDPRRLSSGISQALVTTELGLAVAIPALLLHTLFDRWAERILSRVQTDSMVLIHDLACHRDPEHPHAHAHGHDHHGHDHGHHSHDHGHHKHGPASTSPAQPADSQAKSKTSPGNLPPEPKA